MNKEGIATSAYFIEMWRWFTEKLTKWSKNHNEAWIKELKHQHILLKCGDGLLKN